jgi:hypothetical protein
MKREKEVDEKRR